MKELCKSCNVCVGLGIQEQTKERILSYTWGKLDADLNSQPLILVIDDQAGDREVPMNILADIFPTGITVSYTHTIRCEYGSGDFKSGSLVDAVNRCAVWTNLLIGDRQIILTTSAGMRQMGLPVANWEDGKIYNSPAHGLILCIAPLAYASGVSIEKYRVQVTRMLKSVKTGEKL